MRKIRLLDCTLRDGGYVNDWNFGLNNLISIYERLVDSGVEIIEVGFLDDRRPFDINRSIMPDTESVKGIWKTTSKRPPMIVGMIDYGTCDIENLQPCEESYVDGIRVIFKKHLMKEAMEYCRQVQKLGYKVFSQLVSITSYSDEELLQLVELVNDVKPYAVSMVDTYGILHPQDLLHYYEILDENVDKSVQIGFHAHNNFQLAYANALAFIEKETERDIVVDGTLYGMGKSAGNAPIELLAMRLNEKFGMHYNIHPMMEAIEESVLDFYREAQWGYQPFYYLCGLNKCHPNYLTYLQEKENLSVSKIDTLLSRIEPEENKLLYKRSIIEEIYDEYMKNESDDSENYEKLAKILCGREILLVGPGKNIHLQKKKVQAFIKEKAPLVISINYVPEEFKTDFVFVTNSKRYQQMTEDLHSEGNENIRLIVTSNVECKSGVESYELNRAPLLEMQEQIKDNSFLMLLRVLKKAGANNITCAGFDGYSKKEDNYFDPKMEYYFVKTATSYLNSHVREQIKIFRETMKINFITYTHYDELEDDHETVF